MDSCGTGQDKILVVEDEAGITQVCQRTLIPEGYQVDTATNGAIALNMLLQEDYDLVIIDLRMPVMDGMQLYQYIEDRRPKLMNRVVFATGDVMSTATEQFLQQTRRPFLLKPFTPEQLKAMVRQTLKQMHMVTLPI